MTPIKRAGWAVAAVVVGAFALFEAVKYGGWAWGAAGVGLLGPDLAFLAAIGAPVPEHGRLPARAVRSYNLLHRCPLPVGAMAISALVPISHAAFVPWFVLGLAWLTHIALDRALGFGLRAADGRIAGATQVRDMSTAHP